MERVANNTMHSDLYAALLAPGEWEKVRVTACTCAMNLPRQIKTETEDSCNQGGSGHRNFERRQYCCVFLISKRNLNRARDRISMPHTSC